MHCTPIALHFQVVRDFIRTFILSSFRHIRQKTFYSFPASAKHIRRVAENKGLKYNMNSAEYAYYEIYRQMQDTRYDTGTELVDAKELLVRDPDSYLLRFPQDLGTEKYD